MYIQQTPLSTSSSSSVGSFNNRGTCRIACLPQYTPGHLFLDSASNLGPLITCWQINKFEDCWYKSVRILKALELLFQQFLNLSRFQRDWVVQYLEICPIIGDLGALYENHTFTVWSKKELKLLSSLLGFSWTWDIHELYQISAQRPAPTKGARPYFLLWSPPTTLIISFTEVRTRIRR